MNIIQCKTCRKPFHSIGSRICPECLHRIDMDFITVRDYIYDNEGADIDTVAEETGVEKAIILHLLKEGRLTLATRGGGGHLTCEMCKTPINTGRLCNTCKDKVSSFVQDNPDAKKPPAPESDPSKRSSKMHTRE